MLVGTLLQRLLLQFACAIIPTNSSYAYPLNSCSPDSKSISTSCEQLNHFAILFKTYVSLAVHQGTLPPAREKETVTIVLLDLEQLKYFSMQSFSPERRRAFSDGQAFPSRGSPFHILPFLGKV
ncbi:hypothetical protein TNIN_272811 [Trichonephila inaurata madagascariensis]|uniref:Secreted protein n=1 Tax=Trichonephila inaurata madagascariensis TaxID=2747483 RepID=A0A8X7CA21_9ARAC|nr:hypothetical protein TNIN_272811 [Trichonephila inaurata madagascariensis]